MPVRRLLTLLRRAEGRPAVPTSSAKQTGGSSALGLPAWPTRRSRRSRRACRRRCSSSPAVVARPELVILDEPFSGLDPVNATCCATRCWSCKRRGTTIVFSTHDMAMAEQMCDRIFMIFKGRKVLDGTLDEIQATLRARHRACARTGRRGRAARRSQGVESVIDHGNMQEVRLSVDPQAFLGPAGRAHRGPPLRDHAAVAARHLRGDRAARARRRRPSHRVRPHVMSRVLTSPSRSSSRPYGAGRS